MKQLFLIMVVILFYNTKATAQIGSSKDSCTMVYDSIINRIVYTIAGKMPEYVGGEIEILNYIRKNFNYTPDANNFQASFRAEFVIDENGVLIGERIRNKKLEDITQAEREFLRMLKSMPKWIAGRCNEKPVPVKINLPLQF